eukprot:s3058_g18.t1
MLASRNGHVTVAAQLVAARASLTAWNGHDFTALHFAALHDQVDIARFLLASRARVNVPDREGESPLTFACTDASATMVRLLLEARAGADLASDDGDRPLMRNVDLARLLVDSGAATAPVLAKAKKNGNHAIIDFMQTIAAKRPRLDTSAKTDDDTTAPAIDATCENVLVAQKTRNRSCQQIFQFTLKMLRTVFLRTALRRSNSVRSLTA